MLAGGITGTERKETNERHDGTHRTHPTAPPVRQRTSARKRADRIAPDRLVERGTVALRSRLRGSLGRPSVRYRRIQPGHFNSPYNVTVWDMLSRISVDARYVNRLAVVDAGNDYAREEDCARKMTYGDLLETASALAMYLVSRGLQRGDRVALVMPNALEVMVAHYACAR